MGNPNLTSDQDALTEECEASQIPTMGNPNLTSDQDEDDKDLSKREEDDLVLSV